MVLRNNIVSWGKPHMRYEEARSREKLKVMQ